MKNLFFFLFLTSFSFQTAFAQEKEERPKVYSLVNDLRVRKTPDLKGEVIAKLALKDSAYYLNTSEEVVTVNLRGKDVTASWTEIEMLNGQKGWAFGGGLASWYVFPTAPKDAKSKAAISITEDSYIIKTTNSGTKTLKSIYPLDLASEEEMKVFHFDNYYSTLKSYGFNVSFIEYSGYMLVNEENGNETEITANPVLSPSKKLLICLSHVPEADVLTMYKLEGTKITQLWEQELMNGIRVYDKVEWVSEKELKLIGNEFESDIPKPVFAIFDINTKKIKF